MPGIYIIANEPDKAAELVAYAKDWGKPSTVIVTCEDPSEYTNTGADRLVHLSGNNPVPESYIRAISDFLKTENPEIVLAGTGVADHTVAAGIAGYLDCAMATDAQIVELEGETLRVDHATYGGMVVETDELPLPCVASVSTGKREPASGNVEIEELAVEPCASIELVSTSPKETGSVDLGKAERVVCVGLGVKKQEDMKLIEELAKSLNAEIACTRSIAEERKWLPEERYVGITGAILESKLYLSVGVSGQVQHTYGIRDVDTVMAIDTDSKAPIFKNADYGVVGDLYEVIPALIESCGK
ncbi:MAG: electron transfer flavoprotein subunit alpha/FixB family protein [Coriobacteriales bacterium]|jgi:electron transfer flavoprotein alpha subunit